MLTLRDNFQYFVSEFITDRKLERIHKCKRCNKYVCAKCGAGKQKILNEQGNWTSDARRVCLNCHE